MFGNNEYNQCLISSKEHSNISYKSPLLLSIKDIKKQIKQSIIIDLIPGYKETFIVSK